MNMNESEREELREVIDNSVMLSKEVIEELGYSRERLRQLVEDGRIKIIRTGLYMREDIEAFKIYREKHMRKRHDDN